MTGYDFEIAISEEIEIEVLLGLIQATAVNSEVVSRGTDSIHLTVFDGTELWLDTDTECFATGVLLDDEASRLTRGRTRIYGTLPLVSIANDDAQRLVRLAAAIRAQVGREGWYSVLGIAHFVWRNEVTWLSSSAEVDISPRALAGLLGPQHVVVLARVEFCEAPG